MGLAPLFGWRKTSKDALKKAFRIPLAALAVTYVLHLAFGARLGYPPFVEKDAFYPGVARRRDLQKIGRRAARHRDRARRLQPRGDRAGVRARHRRAPALRAKSSGEQESVLVALVRLVDKNRRRYGGYIVHLGICAMFVGFTGGAWGIETRDRAHAGPAHVDRRLRAPLRGLAHVPGQPALQPRRAGRHRQAHDLRRAHRVQGRQRSWTASRPRSSSTTAQPESPTTEVAHPPHAARGPVHRRRHRRPAEQARDLRVSPESARLVDLDRRA